MHFQSSRESVDMWSQAYTSYAPSDKNSTSIDSIELEFKVPKVKIRLFRNNMSSTKYEPVLLMKECEEFVGEINLLSPTSIFYHTQNQKIKIRQDHSISDISAAEIKSNGYQALAKIIQYYNVLKKPCFDIITRPHQTPLSRNQILKFTFINLRDRGFNKMSLKTDDFVKFGRELYRINIVDDTLCPNFNWLKEMKIQAEKIEGMCRICLSNQQQADNYIISPCACTGSCGYVHIHCLRQWLNTRMILYRADKVIAYNFQIFECEVCKADLPKYMKVKQDLVQLLPMKLQCESFVMLQKLSESKKISYVIPFRQGRSVCLKIGRSEENDIIMNDMSISRRHAYLNIYAGGDVQLSDNKSKFGTFVALKRNVYNCQKISFVSNRYLFKVDLYNES